MKGFKKLGSHYAIESFGITFAVLFLAMVLVVGSITSKQIAANHRSLSGNAQYTKSFIMSQTQSAGVVRGVYSNTDHTRVFLLLQFEDMSALPTTADQYQMFLAGCNLSGVYEKLKSSPSGFLYVFGSTGYMGIYLQDVAGFPSQLCQLYLRANVNFTGTQATGYADDTFNKYNQAKIVFNPGGAFAVHADFLESDTWTAEDMVEEILCRNQEVSIRQSLRADLMQMVQQQLLIDEYSQRVQDLNVVLPNAPAVIANDALYALEKTGSYTERLHYIVNWGGGWVNATSSKGFKNDAVTVYLDSPYVVPNGFDFEWQNGRILNGYLENLTGTTNLSQWIGYIAARRQADKQSSVLTFTEEINRMIWKMVDGTIISLKSEDALTQAQKDILSTINWLIAAWQRYYDLKVQYETVDLVALLQLESDFRNAVDAYTVNTGENGPVLTLW